LGEKDKGSICWRGFFVGEKGLIGKRAIDRKGGGYI